MTKERADLNFLNDVVIPAAQIRKLFRDRFKPLKHAEHVRRDLIKQPLHGLWNVVSSVIGLASNVVGFVLFAPIIAAATGQFKNKNFWRVQGQGLLAGLTKLALGVSQLALWVPNLLIFTPIRAIMTKLKGAPKIEDSSSLRKLTDEFDRNSFNATSQMLILKSLYEKAAKSIKRGQKSLFGADAQIIVQRSQVLNDVLKLEPEARIQDPRWGLFQRIETYDIGLFRNAIRARDVEIAAAKRPYTPTPQRRGA